jgi:hypothetical protein
MESLTRLEQERIIQDNTIEHNNDLRSIPVVTKAGNPTDLPTLVLWDSTTARNNNDSPVLITASLNIVVTCHGTMNLFNAQWDLGQTQVVV